MKHTPKEMAAKGNITITWEMLIKTEKKLNCNKPDILIHNSAKSTRTTINVEILVYTNIVHKIVEKLTKHRELETEL